MDWRDERLERVAEQLAAELHRAGFNGSAASVQIMLACAIERAGMALVRVERGHLEGADR